MFDAHRSSTRRLRAFAAALPVTIVGSSAIAQPVPFFADWGLDLLPWTDGLPCAQQSPFGGDPAVEYTYIPHPGGGHGWPALHVRTTCTYDRLTAAGAVRAVMIRNRNCPFPYDLDGATPSPDTVDEVLSHVPDMEFVFMDLEGDTVLDIAPNVDEVVIRARTAHPSVRIGNYAYFAGTYDPTMPYSNQADRTNDSFGGDLNAIYLTSGMDVSMPDCYPYSPFIRHTLANHYSGTAPNVRSALFWAPLERFSIAKRNLPAGHLLIPWVTPFIVHPDFQATPPTVRDVEAIVQHYRFRGADAFYAFSQGASTHPDFSEESYRQLVKSAWLDLDPYFAAGAPIEILNLDTNKTGGVEWSGIKVGSQVTVLATNLSDTGPATVTLPAIVGLPATVTVNNNEHAFFEFNLCPADLDGSGAVGFADVLQIIGAWGACGPECPEDLNDDGSVSFADILVAIGAWGACG